MAITLAYNLLNASRKYRKLRAVSTFGAADCGVSPHATEANVS